MPACQKKCQLLNFKEETEKKPEISQSKCQSVSLKNFGTEIVKITTKTSIKKFWYNG